MVPKQVATREGPVLVVRLRVKPALNPDEKHRRGLQKYRVLRTAAVSSTKEVARDDAMHAILPVLAIGGRQPPETASEGGALRAPRHLGSGLVKRLSRRRSSSTSTTTTRD